MNNFFRSNLPGIYNVVQNAMIVYPKELIISVLRDHFEKDEYYHYSKDSWGFPNTPNHTDLDLEAGLGNELSSRVFIGEYYRFDGIMYPAILVKHNSSKSVPISMNREKGSIIWDFRKFDDGYNISFVRYPKSYLLAGSWEGSLSIEIMSRSLRARDELAQEVALCLTDIEFDTLQYAGLICKPISISAPTEGDDRNDKLFRQTITVDIRSDWRREIPVNNLIQTINFAVEFGNLSNPEELIAPNLTIYQSLNLIDIMSG